MSFKKFGTLVEEDVVVEEGASEGTTPEFKQFGTLVEEGIEAPQQETFGQATGRHAARSGARAGETILGLPGDLLDLIRTGAKKGAQLLGVPEELTEEVAKYQRLLSPSGKLKTSEELKEKVTDPLGGEFLKPQSRKEEISDTIVQDATAMLLPMKTKVPKSGKLIVPAFKKLFRGIGTAAGANLASEFAGELGAGEKGKFFTKLGSMLILGTLGRGTPGKAVGKLYDKAEGAITRNSQEDARGLKKGLTSLREEISLGLDSPSEKAALSKIDKMLGKIKEGKVKVKELWNSKRSLNEEVSTLYKDAPNKTARKNIKRLFENINNEIRKPLNEYAKKNSAFGKPFKEAEEGFAALAQSEVIGNFIQRNVKKGKYSFLLYPLIHAFPKAALKTGVAGGGIGMGAAAAYKGGKLAYQLAKSKAVRDHYKNVVKSAARENAVAMNNALRKLDKALTKEK